MATAKLSHTQWQITVRFQTLIEDLNVSRTVHWLDAIFTVFRRGREHRFFVVFPVTGFFPQHAVHHERTFYFLIVIRLQFHAYKGFQLTENGPAVVVPEHHTWCFFLHMVQVKLLTNFTVVTFTGFFQTLNVSIQLLFIRPRSAVDTLQHFVIAVATPVSTGGFLQFEMMAETHVRYVRTTAHIHVFFVVIQTRMVIMTDVFIQNRHFVFFATACKGIARFLPADFLFNDVVILFSQFVHALFKQFDIFLSQRTI
ncbi:hypothetical protein SRABI106_03407 [Rahnella aquatilis]|nr:hypothetical protein SRABI106_03407 [Rahnella aquatilis]